MTLSQLNRIAAQQHVEPDLPGVHSTGMVAKMPSEAQKSLFDQMRAAIGPLTDVDAQVHQEKLQAASRRIDELEQQLLAAHAEYNRLAEITIEKL